MSKKILIAYFSHSGNTQEIAHQINEFVGGDVFRIEPVNDYPSNYQEVLKVSKVEIDNHIKPDLKEKVNDVGQYDILFIGSPNWYSTVAPPVVSFLANYDFSGKVVVPFITHAGGGAANCFTDIKTMSSDSTILQGLVISGSQVKTADQKIRSWLRDIKLLHES
ncbi:MAG: flavodoxin [Candidatus Hermodarchaeota archaeon]